MDEALENYRAALSEDLKIARQEEVIRAKRAKTRLALSIARDELRSMEMEQRTYAY
jgi:hypothetical protein